MTLSQKQQAFTVLVARLILHATEQGWGLTFGEAHRSPEEAARLARVGSGIKNSLHTERLAVDFNLWINGQYQNASEAYRPLGEWWEAQSTDALTCAWGGRFGDGDHFSVAHGGRK